MKATSQYQVLNDPQELIMSRLPAARKLTSMAKIS